MEAGHSHSSGFQTSCSALTRTCRKHGKPRALDLSLFFWQPNLNRLQRTVLEHAGGSQVLSAGQHLLGCPEEAGGAWMKGTAPTGTPGRTNTTSISTVGSPSKPQAGPAQHCSLQQDPALLSSRVTAQGPQKEHPPSPAALPQLLQGRTESAHSPCSHTPTLAIPSRLFPSGFAEIPHLHPPATSRSRSE